MNFNCFFFSLFWQQFSQLIYKNFGFKIEQVLLREEEGGGGVLQCIHAQCWKREHKHENIAWHFLLESIVFINIIRLLDSIFFFQQILEILKISQWQNFSHAIFFLSWENKKKTALENDIKISFDSIPFCFFFSFFEGDSRVLCSTFRGVGGGGGGRALQPLQNQ